MRLFITITFNNGDKEDYSFGGNWTDENINSVEKGFADNHAYKVRIKDPSCNKQYVFMLREIRSVIISGVD